MRNRPHNLPNPATPPIYLEATCTSITRYPERGATMCDVNFKNIVVQQQDRPYILIPTRFDYHIGMEITNYARSDDTWVLFQQPFCAFYNGLSLESRRRIGEVEEVKKKAADSEVNLFDLVGQKKRKIVIFIVNGNRIAAPFYVGKSQIVIRAEASSANCIDIFIEPSHIELDNYYYYIARQDCPSIDHEIFFKLLDALSASFGKPIVLIDASTKQVREGENCNFPNFFMAVAKDVSFYNRFGFQNARFTEDLRKTQQLQLSTLQGGALNELFQTISKTTSDISLKEAAQYALDNCHHNTPEMQEFIISLTEELESLIPENSSFKRPRSTSVYEVNVVEEQDHFVVEFTEEGTKRKKEHATGTGGRRQRSRRSRRYRRSQRSRRSRRSARPFRLAL